MEVRVLGCYGGSMPGMRLTCLQVGQALLDAGSATALELEEQLALQAVLLSHPHLDHIKDLFLVADNRHLGGAPRPLEVFGTAQVLEALRFHLLNFSIWPDFTRLPDREAPTLRLVPIKPGEDFEAAGLSVQAVPVNHFGLGVGFIVSSGDACLVFSGDTGPTELLWQKANRRPNLKAVFLETTFPNRLAGLAKESGHLTPAMLAEELKKLAREVWVYLFHMKPQFLAEIEAEVKALARPRLSLLAQDQRLSL